MSDSGSQVELQQGSESPSEVPVSPPAPEPVLPDPQPEQQPPAAPEPAPQQQRQVDWRDRRIGEQQARIRELRAQLERFQSQVDPTRVPQQSLPPDRELIEREIQQRAEAMASEQEFTRRCNDVADMGRRVFPDFDTRVNKLVGLVDSNDPRSVAGYNAFLNAAMETGEAPKLIHALGGDLNEAARVLSLNPVRMAVELTKMSARPINEISSAPRPINPAATQALSNRTGLSPDDPNSDGLTTQEWMRRREEQLSARRQVR